MTRSDQLIGLRLGQYEIVSLIGKGGMATVYRATQTSVKRTVAIKVLPSQFTHDDTFMTRFKQEAELIANLEHPHILPIHDYGQYEDMPFLVMRYVEGGSAHDCVRTGRMTPEKASQILLQIGSALDYAHAHDVLHRDVKPSNFLLDRQGNAYLTDFGLARLMDTGIEVTGSNIVGTPAYIAPEQAEQGMLTQAIDIYSMGVAAFEMLTGQLPYVGDTPIAQILMHVQRPVPSARMLNPSLSMETDLVIKRAMAKRPLDRYETALSMAEDLAVSIVGPGEHPPTEDHASDTDPSIDFSLIPGQPTAPAPGSDPILELPSLDSLLPEMESYAAPSSGVNPRPFLRSVLFGAVALIALLAVIGGISLGMRNTAGGTAATATVAVAAIVPTNSPTDVPTPTVEAVQPVATETPTATAAPTDVPSTATEPPTPTLSASSTSAGPLIYQGSAQMMLVSEGPFEMGSIRGLQDENPEHEVLMDAFYIDRFEVTIGGYEGCVAAGACQPPPIVRSRTRSVYYGVPGLENFPVIYVTWQEAQTYCKWRGAHLPTEAQWEKAARWDPQAGRAREVPWLLEGAIDRYFLNYGGSLFGDTRAISNYPQGASYYGMEDASGNVAEWVYDWYGADFYDITPYANPSGPQDGTDKVFRGGSFASFGAELRPAARRYAPPDSREETLGFRCAFTPNGDPTQP